MMSGKETENCEKLNDETRQDTGAAPEKLNDETYQSTKATPLDLKACSNALKESYDKGYAEGLLQQKCDEGDVDERDNTACDDDAEEEEIPRVVEYDDEYMKEIHSNMTDEQLQELKEKSSDLKNSGNVQYKNNCHSEAVDLYTQALNCCPLQFFSERSILYANRSAAYIGLDNKKSAVEDCNKALELNPNYVRATIRRAQLHRKMDSLDQSLEDYKKVLELDPTNCEARQACAVLPGEINERNEKLKAEMLGKLKDLGNLVLRPFGLSTDNFNMVQDPNTGGYSVNFQNKSQK